MSWRADAVRRCRFDEDLRLPRSLWEDFSLSYAVLRDQILVEATTARVYHHRFGGSRGNGLVNGAEQLLNICYLVCKYSPPASRSPGHQTLCPPLLSRSRAAGSRLEIRT